MKKVICLMLVLTMCISLTSCNFLLKAQDELDDMIDNIRKDSYADVKEVWGDLSGADDEKDALIFEKMREGLKYRITSMKRENNDATITVDFQNSTFANRFDLFLKFFDYSFRMSMFTLDYYDGDIYDEDAVFKNVLSLLYLGDISMDTDGDYQMPKEIDVIQNNAKDSVELLKLALEGTDNLCELLDLDEMTDDELKNSEFGDISWLKQEHDGESVVQEYTVELSFHKSKDGWEVTTDNALREILGFTTDLTTYIDGAVYYPLFDLSYAEYIKSAPIDDIDHDYDIDPDVDPDVDPDYDYDPDYDEPDFDEPDYNEPDIDVPSSISYVDTTEDSPAKLGEFVLIYDYNPSVDGNTPVYVRLNKIIQGSDADAMYKEYCEANGLDDYEPLEDTEKRIIFDITVDYSDYGIPDYGKTVYFSGIKVATKTMKYQTDSTDSDMYIPFSQWLHLGGYDGDIVSPESPKLDHFYVVSSMLVDCADPIIVVNGMEYDDLQYIAYPG